MRAFLAIEMNAAVKERYAQFYSGAAGRLQFLRWVRPENLHLTLRFLGDIDQGEAKAISREVADAARAFPAFSVALGDPGCFGPHRGPNVLWFGMENAAALERLEKAIDPVLRKLSFPPEKKPWHAHLTVARNPKQARFENWQEELSSSGLTGLSVGVESISLFSSQTLPEGPVYSLEARAPLDAR